MMTISGWRASLEAEEAISNAVEDIAAVCGLLPLAPVAAVEGGQAAACRGAYLASLSYMENN